MKYLLSVLVCATLTACVADTHGVQNEPYKSFAQDRPDGADPSTCWGKQVTPAIIETVTRQTMVHPPEVRADGTVTSPGIYKTEKVQKIVREREENWFQTPCQDDLTEDFVASLQRALAVRGYYLWPINGQLDARTRTAIRRYQEPQGLDADVLSLEAARQLGLASVDLDLSVPETIRIEGPNQ